MKNMYLATATLAIILLAGCSKDEYSGQDRPGVKAEIWGTINHMGTRASGTTWASNDCIGVTVEGGDMNIQYKYGGGDQPFKVVEAGSDVYLKGTENSQTLTAYYPYTGENGTSPNPVIVSTTTGFQIATEQPKIDFLFATATGSRENPSVTFQFSHVMSKIDFEFKDGSDVLISSETVDFSITDIIVQGAFDPATGTATAGDIKGTIEGTTSDGTASFIVLPQTNTISVLLQLSYKGTPYRATITTMTLEAKKKHLYTVTINDMDADPKLIIESAGINDWGEGNGQNIDTEKDNNALQVTPPSDNSEQPEFGNSGKGQDITSNPV